MSEATSGATSTGASDGAGAPADGGQAQTQATTPDAAPAEARHKLTIDGEEVELPLSEVLALAQKGKGAEKRFREAAESRKQVEDLVRKLPEDPVSALVHLMGDKSAAAKAVTKSLLRDPEVRSAFEEAFLEHLDYESLPAEERQKRDRVTELEAKARRADEYEKAEKERAQQAAEAQYVQSFTARFSEALGAVGLPVSQRTMARMAMHTEAALETQERVTVQQIAERVRDELHEDVRSFTGSLDGEPLAALLGPAAAKLQKAAAAKLAPRAPVPERQPGAGKRPPERPTPPTERRRAGTSSFFRRVRGEG